MLSSDSILHYEYISLNSEKVSLFRGVFSEERGGGKEKGKMGKNDKIVKFLPSIIPLSTLSLKKSWMGLGKGERL